MILETTKELIDKRDGTVFCADLPARGRVNLTPRIVVTESLLSPADKPRTMDETRKILALVDEILTKNTVSLTDEQSEMILAAVHRYFNPLVFGEIDKVLSPKTN